MFPGIGYQELLVFAVLAVLLFGKRLPEVARSLGQSYHEFRRGLHDLKGEVDSAVSIARSESTVPAQRYLSQQPIAANPSDPPFPMAESLVDVPSESAVESLSEPKA